MKAYDIIVFTEYRGFFGKRANFTTIISQYTCLCTKNLRIILTNFTVAFLLMTMM